MYGGKGKSIGKKRVTVVGGSDGVNAPPSTAGHKSCLFAHQHIYPNVHRVELVLTPFFLKKKASFMSMYGAHFIFISSSSRKIFLYHKSRDAF